MTNEQMKNVASLDTAGSGLFNWLANHNPELIETHPDYLTDAIKISEAEKLFGECLDDVLMREYDQGAIARGEVFIYEMP